MKIIHYINKLYHILFYKGDTVKEKILLFLKGFLIGIGKIIPGASGSVIAISLGLYEKGIYAINELHKRNFSNIIFLGLVGSGVLSAIVIFSYIIKYFLGKYYFLTMLLFIGMIIGGTSFVYQKVKSKLFNFKFLIFSILIGLIIFLGLWLSRDILLVFSKTSYIFYFILGIIEAITMVIPGISGTATMILLGGYDSYLTLLGNIGNIDYLGFLIVFGIGVIIGIFLTVKLVAYFLKKFEIESYFFIMLLLIISMFLLFLKTFSVEYTIIEIIIGIGLLFIGYKITKER